MVFANTSKFKAKIILLVRSDKYFVIFFYSGPTAGLRAVRILHDLLVGNKKLVAKVDAKNKLLLDNYKEEETKKLGSLSKSNEEQERKDDTVALDKIGRIIDDFQSDIDNYESIQEGMRAFIEHYIKCLLQK